VTINYAEPRNEGEFDQRVHVRLTAALAERLRDAFFSLSKGVRAAMRYAVDVAPLDRWPVADEADDLENTAIERVTVRVPPTLDEDLGRVVEQEPAPGQSRAVRDAARDLLG
jgi:hypothetical protein